MQQALTDLRVSLFVACVALAGLVRPVVAQEQPFGLDRYEALQSAVDAADAYVSSVEALDPVDGSTLREAQTAARERREELLGFLGDWAASGSMPEEWTEFAERAQWVLIENVVLLNAEVDACGEARAGASELEARVPNDDTEADALLRASWNAVERCDERALAAEAAAAAAEAATRAAPSSRPPIGAIATTGAGATLLVAGVAWNLTLLDDRRNHRAAERACRRGSFCDVALVDATSERLQRGKIPIALLVTSGVVATAVGSTIWATDDRRADVSVSPGGVHVAWGGR